MKNKTVKSLGEKRKPSKIRPTDPGFRHFILQGEGFFLVVFSGWMDDSLSVMRSKASFDGSWDGEIVAETTETLVITRNEREVSWPIIRIDTNCNAILFIETPTMPGRTMPIGQLQRHVSRSFLVMTNVVCTNVCHCKLFSSHGNPLMNEIRMGI